MGSHDSPTPSISRRPVTSPEEIDDGAYFSTELRQFGPGGRALRGPCPGDPARWHWSGDSVGEGGAAGVDHEDSLDTPSGRERDILHRAERGDYS